MSVPFYKLYNAFVDVFAATIVNLCPSCTLKSYTFVEPAMSICGEEWKLNQLLVEDKLVPTLDRIIHSDKHNESDELLESIRKHAALKQ